MDLFEWGDLIDQTKNFERLLRVPMPVESGTNRFKPLVAKFTAEDEELFRNMMRRLKIITEVGVCGMDLRSQHSISGSRCARPPLLASALAH